MHLLRCLLPVCLLFSASCRVIELGSTAQEIPTDSTAQTSTEVIPEPAEQTFPYRPSRSRTHDLLHTRLEVQPRLSNKTLEGEALLHLKPYFYPQNHLVLDAKGFDIHRVTMPDGEGEEGDELEYIYNGSQLKIDLGRSFSQDEDYFISIRYTARPYELRGGGSAAISENRGLYFVGVDSLRFGQQPVQVWTQGETEAASCWFPTIDAPNERTTQEMFITVDERFQTLSNGILVYSQHNADSTRTDYWKMDQSHAPYLFMMAIGEYARVEEEWRGKEVSYYVEPSYQQYADDVFGHTPEMLSFFSEILGMEYPWPKYSQVVVRNFVSGAMENTTASVFMEDLQVDDRELIDQHWDGIIAHELFHHWFGDLVTCESWANLPLNEAFATYSEYLWTDYKYGHYEADLLLDEQKSNYLAEAEEKKVNLIRYHYADQEDMFDRHSYDKGSLVLHMLRTHLGDDAFFAALEYYLRKHAYQSVEVHDLRLAFEKVSGRDLNWFFNQWFLSAGHPKLQVSHEYDSGLLRLSIRQQQDTEKYPLYQLPTQLLIREGGKNKLIALDIYEKEQSWEFPLSSAPELVLLDPGADLLAEVQHNRQQAGWAAQYRYAGAFAHQLEALQMIAADSLSAAEARLLEDALAHDFWAIRQTALNLLQDQPGVWSADVLQKAEEMARDDQRSLVRADALSLLAAADAEAYRAFFRDAMQDSSYAVVGSAVAAYSLTEAGDKAALYEPLQEYDNFNVVIALADYFVEEAVTGKYGWFSRKMEQVGDEALYYLLNYFARYLMTAEEQVQDKGIALLADYAEFHPRYYIRLNAYRSLGFFAEKEEVQQMRSAIRQAENDPRLQELYRESVW